VLTLAGQQLLAAVAIRLANVGAPDGTQVVYAAGLTLFLVPWAALAVPLATSAYPGLAERAEAGDEDGFTRALAPVAVLTVVTAAVAVAALVATAGSMARIFLSGDPSGTVTALRDTIVAFPPGLLGYGLVALLTRALYARGLWKAPTVCVVSGWLLAVVADVVLAGLLPPEDRGLALGLGHTIGVTVAGVGLLAVVARVAGPQALRGLPHAGGAALLAAALAGAAGLGVAGLLDVHPVPPEAVTTALVAGAAVGATVLVVAAAVMMGTARGPLRTALRELRTSGRQEVLGG
jgi:putative peptidoglycan lipid II flippase